MDDYINRFRNKVNIEAKSAARIGDIIEFEAKGRFEDARKREIKVIGKINEIKVFEGIFQAVLLEKHILKTKLDELQANFNAKDFM